MTLLNKVSSAVKKVASSTKKLVSGHTHVWHKDRQIFVKVAPKKYVLKFRDVCASTDCGEYRFVDIGEGHV